MPGLVDAHVHLRDPGELVSYLAYGVTSVAHLGGPAVAAGLTPYQALAAEWYLPGQIAKLRGRRAANP
jgi:predicted amidohydrolase YtcJ